jgi:hypothetical protein
MDSEIEFRIKMPLKIIINIENTHDGLVACFFGGNEQWLIFYFNKVQSVFSLFEYILAKMKELMGPIHNFTIVGLVYLK